MTDENDVLWLGFRNDKEEVVSLKLEGFGFTEAVNETQDHPRYDEILEAFKKVASQLLGVEVG